VRRVDQEVPLPLAGWRRCAACQVGALAEAEDLAQLFSLEPVKIKKDVSEEKFFSF
jgi:hypothetical protein